MSADVSTVLSELKTLSDTADSIIDSINHENHIENWFKIIRETASAIINGKNSNLTDEEGCTVNSSSNVVNLPNLVSLVKGNEPNVREHRLSVLLAEVKKDHVRHSNRKSRKSLRKLAQGKEKGNSQEISNPKNSIRDAEKNSTPKSEIKNKLLESHIKTPHQSFSLSKNENKKCITQLSSELNEVQNDINSYTINKVLENPSIESSTPGKQSKVNIVAATQIVKGKKKVIIPLQCDSAFNTPIPVKRNTRQSHEKYDSLENKISEKIESTPKKCSDFKRINETIILDSDCSGELVKKFETPVKRSKRKYTVQYSQENVKRIKKVATDFFSKTSDKPSKIKRVKNLIENETFKQIKKAKNLQDPVISVKLSNIITKQPNYEKRILQEIQKRDDIVNQNAKKIKSLQNQKIEAAKKARELKMEKALHQRMKIEKEKEEQLRSHAHSAQENSQQKKLSSTKIVSKKMSQDVKNKCSITVDVISSSEKLKSSVCDPKTKELLASDKVKFAKPTLNATFVNIPDVKTKDTTSTPVTKKIESKLNLSKQSCSVTSSEDSFVCYDVSEIKSDSDEEEECKQKPIPSWAKGIRFKNAILSQLYNPLDCEELFGNFFEIPKLEDIMGVKKSHYNKRTSSARWTRSPDRSILL